MSMGLLPILALLAAITEPTQAREVRIQFPAVPHDTLVRCLEGCDRFTDMWQTAKDFHAFPIDEERSTVRLLIAARDYLPLIVELVVTPGVNVVVSSPEPRPVPR